MAKYLFQANYKSEGLKGLLKEGGVSRRTHLSELIEGLGGNLESFYYAFGEYDLYAIAELPDHASSTALSMIVNAAGTVSVNTVVLLTPEEVDEAAKVITEAADSQANIIFGAVINENYTGEIKVTVIATGFSEEDQHRMQNASAAGTIQRLGNAPTSNVKVTGVQPGAKKGADVDLEVPAFMRKTLKK